MRWVRKDEKDDKERGRSMRRGRRMGRGRRMRRGRKEKTKKFLEVRGILKSYLLA